MSEEQVRDADPNESTEGLLDEEHLRDHAADVDRQIREARNRNPYVPPDAPGDDELGTEDADISGPVPGDD
jgi:hypothetical protein